MKTHRLIPATLVASLALILTAFAQAGGGRGGAPAGPGPRPGSPAPQSPTPAQRAESPAPQRQAERVQSAVENQANGIGLAQRLHEHVVICREIGLSDEQIATIARIRDRERDEVQKAERRWLATRTQKDTRIHDIIARHTDEVRALLTPDQLQRLDQIIEREPIRLQNPERK